MTATTTTLPAARTPAQQLGEAIQRMAPNLAQSLPPGVDPDRFVRVCQNAVQNNRDLLTAERGSIFTACIRAAQDGLLPDGREGAIVIYSVKVGDSWEKRAQWQPMVGGLRKIAAKYGYAIDAQVVYAKDRFEYELGDNPRIVHVPPSFGDDRGDIIGAYAVATDERGSKYREVMSKAEIEKVKSASKSGDKGPWGTWFSEMARKTVVKRLFKQLPMGFNEYEQGVLERDNEDYDLGDGGAAAVVVEQATTTAPPSGKRPKALAKVVEAARPAGEERPPIEGEASPAGAGTEQPAAGPQNGDF